MPRRVLVAGCGDVGTRLALRLRQDGDDVVALRRRPEALPAGLQGVALDLCASTPWPALPGPFDAVVYCPAPDRRDETAYRALFLDGSRRLRAALAPAPARSVFVSSTAVYGEEGGEHVDEDTPPRPAAFNGRVLLEAEAAWRAADPRLVVLRLAGLHGPGRTRMAARAAAGERGEARWINRLHVDAAAAALHHLLALDAPAALYLASETPVREDVLLARLRGEPPPPPGGGPVRGRRIDAGRLARSGWTAA